MGTLAEMEARFARSTRRAAKLRRRRPPRNPMSRTASVVLAAAALLVLTAELAALDIVAGARPPAKKAQASPSQRCPIPPQFRQAFTYASYETGVRLPLLVAMAYEESRMNPSARSHAGAEGLLQVLPATANELQLDVSDPQSNVLAGARYFRRMHKRFGSVDLALAAYNAGPTAVARAGGAPSTETLTYVANVKARAARLSGCR